MADTFKREMLARGVAQVVGELYGSLHAIVALSDEGLEINEVELIRHELNKRAISARDLADILVQFTNGFVAQL